MEKNYISETQGTYFYVDIVEKEYGVIININDINRVDEIIKHFYNDERNKQSIGAWKQIWKEGVA